MKIYALLLFLQGQPAAIDLWRGDDPSCWAESRVYHTEDDVIMGLWRSKVAVSRSVEAPTGEKVVSPNQGYYFALSQRPTSEPNSISMAVYAERDGFAVIQFDEAQFFTNVAWVNEKLIFGRVWWGRIAATDFIFDVEFDRFVWVEPAYDGNQALQQARDSCRTIKCKCDPPADLDKQ